MKKIIALDFGGTFVKYGSFDEKMSIRDRGKIAAPRESETQFFDKVDEIIRPHLGSADAIGISMGGKLDPESGVIMSSGQYPFFNGRSLSEIFQKRYDLPVTILNDARAVAVAELCHGELQDVKNAIVLVLGTGIGGALILNGSIYEGNAFRSAEFSLIRADGERGLEHSWMFSGSATGLVQMSQAALKTAKPLNGLEIFERIHQGDETLNKVLDTFCEKMAVQIYNLQTILDVERIVIGGGISAQPILFTILNRKLDEIYAAEKSFGLPPLKPDVRKCRFDNDSNLIGAWEKAMRRLA